MWKCQHQHKPCDSNQKETGSENEYECGSAEPPEQNSNRAECGNEPTEKKSDQDLKCEIKMQRENEKNKRGDLLKICSEILEEKIEKTRNFEEKRGRKNVQALENKKSKIIVPKKV